MARYYRPRYFQPPQQDNTGSLISAVLGMQAAKETQTVYAQAAIDARAAGVASAALKPLSDIVERMATQGDKAAGVLKLSSVLGLATSQGGGGGGTSPLMWVMLAGGL